MPYSWFSPKNECGRCLEDITSHKFSFYPWTRLECQRGSSQYLLCVTPQALLLPPYSGPTVGYTVCPSPALTYVLRHPVCVSLLSLPTCDPVKMGEGSHACGCWKLKGQKATYKSIDCIFSLPWLLPFAIWVSKLAGPVPVRVDASWPTLSAWF